MTQPKEEDKEAMQHQAEAREATRKHLLRHPPGDRWSAEGAGKPAFDPAPRPARRAPVTYFRVICP